MKIEIGSKRKLLFSIHYIPENGRFWLFGQLYHGYWGLMAHSRMWHIDFWWPHWEA